MNINYINESVISVAVMRRAHTHTHARPTGRGQRGEDVCCVSTELCFSVVEKLANDQ